MFQGPEWNPGQDVTIKVQKKKKKVVKTSKLPDQLTPVG